VRLAPQGDGERERFSLKQFRSSDKKHAVHRIPLAAVPS
jgi:hypothetical protein